MSNERDTLVDATNLPRDPNLPKGDILIDIFSRLSSLSDELHHPDGLLNVQLRAQNDIATRRHMIEMNILRKILAEVLEIKSRMDAVEETVDTHDAKFVLMRQNHTEIQ